MAAIRALLLELLTTPGRAVDAAGSYDDALRVAKQYPPSVALVERSLRGRSGLELTRELRSIDALTEVVLMSALPTPESVIEAVAAGASDYLAKPFEDIDQVSVCVQHAEDRAALRRERARLNRRLRESEARYRKLFEASPDAVLLVDEETGLICDANGAAVSLYGYPRDELVGRDLAALRWPEAGTEEDAGASLAGRRVDG
jgi:DNA-binding NtrC family response regulator